METPQPQTPEASDLHLPMTSGMSRINCPFPNEHVAELVRIARDRHVPKNVLLREAVALYLAPPSKPGRPKKEANARV